MRKTAFVDNKKYSAYTLFELLVVMTIFIILGTLGFSSFNGLQNTVKMNEYMLTLEQNIRSIQRSAMLLERDTDERWLYGLGLDFSSVEEDGTYKIFKWCSPYTDYGNIQTKSNFPSYDPGQGLSLNNGGLPTINKYEDNSCSVTEIVTDDEIITLSGFDLSSTPPKSNIELQTVDVVNEFDVEYIVFESVSGKAFLYDSQGALINYDSEGIPLDDVDNFEITVTPLRNASPRKLTVDNLSGRISTQTL